jgi:hypothetical protein
MRCLLCSFDFDPESAECRPGCPMSGGCNVLCCPRCGHSAPRRETGLAALLRSVLVKLERRR